MTREQADAAPGLHEALNRAGDISKVRFRGKGCEHCNGGVVGRRPLVEALIPNAEVLRLLRAGQDDDAAVLWSEGKAGPWSGRSIGKQVSQMVFRGLVCPYTQLLRGGMARLGLASSGTNERPALKAVVP
jgi:type II secretory ATPase GspE/PulE/Tfp pilus assembly ATPase PilB-like protein